MDSGRGGFWGRIIACPPVGGEAAGSAPANEQLTHPLSHVPRNPQPTTHNSRGVPVSCYLIHFDRPYQHARHYLGFVDGGEEALTARMERHAAGHGSRLLAVIQSAGIGWRLVRTWIGATRSEERRLKRRGGA